MLREISLLRDFVSLCRLWRLFVQLRPELVNASAGKAGLLAGMAAVLSGVPRRVHVLRGLRSETLGGVKKAVMRLAEFLSCACAHRVMCISPSLLRRAVGLGVVSVQKVCILGTGSSNGVVAERFLPTPERLSEACRLRGLLGIPCDAPVVGFVGRLVRDKGIFELVEAYTRLRTRFPSLHLLLVGPYEDGDPLDRQTRLMIETTPGIVTVGQVEDAGAYFHLMDILAFPSHREGFGTVAIEAAVAGKPVVTTNATGAVDTVVDGVTGIVVPVDDPAALARALLHLLSDRELAHRMGRAGQDRAVRDFRPEPIWAGIEGVYRALLRDTNSRGSARKLKNGREY